MKKQNNFFSNFSPGKKISVLIFLFVSTLNLLAQNKITGTVTTESGEALPGVNIVIKGTTVGTVTDIDGNFNIAVAEDQKILEFSFIGYISQEINIEGQTVVNVILKEELEELDEVVVIGYGVQKKSDLTGAVASVSAEDMKKVSSADVLESMKGRTAGVQISPSTGLPDSKKYMRIRGISSINGQDVLWVVDGIVIGNQDQAKMINPADIESMEILKDASTGAIYGSQAANGVVIVTTKKGENNKVTASVNYYRGINKLPNTQEVLNGPQFGEMINELGIIQNKDRFGVIDLKAHPLKFDPDTLPTYNFQEMIFRTSYTDNIDFSVSGGTEKLNSYLGIGYYSTEGIIKNMTYEKLNIRLNNNYKAKDWLEFTNNITFFTEERNGVQEWRFFDEYNSPLSQAISFAPIQEPYIEGAHPDSMWAINPISNISNPFLIIDLEDRVNKSYSGNAALSIIIKPFKGFSFESKINGGIGFDNYRQIERPYYYNASQSRKDLAMTKNYGGGKGFGWQNIVSYNTNILNDFNLSVMIGSEVGKDYYSYLSLGVTELLNREEEMYFFGAPAGDSSKYIPAPQERPGENKGFSYLGRISMDYKSMILVQGNYRRDGSSLFGDKNKFGNFPGGSVGFKFTELEALKGLDWLSFGKIRYGYGSSGNNTLDPYTYYARIGTGTSYANAQYAFDDANYSIGAVPINLANRAVKWETNVTTNLGIDLTFIDNKVSFTFDKFTRSNIDMLYQAKIPGYAGWNLESSKLYFENNDIETIPWINIGKISSRGIEVTLGYKDQVGKLKFDVTGNFTYVRTIADDLKGDRIEEGRASRPNGTFTRTIEGENVGEFYGFDIVKIFKPEDCDTLLINTSTNFRKERWTPVVKATNQPIVDVIPSVLGITDAGDTVFYTKSHWDTIYLQNNASAGDFQFKDVNGDGVLNTDDYISLGNPLAPCLFGFNINLEYGWFDLNMMWQGTYGNKILNTRLAQLSNADGQSNWSIDYFENYYRDAVYDTEGNLVLTARDGKYPRLDPTNRNQNLSSPSEFFIEDGSYLRLKNLQLGLTIPNKYTNKVGISNLRIYCGGINLITFTKYSGLDPEVDLRFATQAGIDRGAYPQPKTWTFGVKLDF